MAKNPVLLVEGINDASVIGNLLSKHGIKTLNKRDDVSDKEDEVIIRDKGSDQKVLNSLKDEIKTADFALGIILDADMDKRAGDAAANRWASVTEHLRSVGYTRLPKKPDPNGTIIEAEAKENPTEPNLPKCGVWIMPFNASSGKLENFIEGLIPPQRKKLWDRATSAVTGIPPDECLFADKDNIKAQIHTFLAWQKEPGKQMGAAVGAGYLLSETPETQTFVDWVRRLISLPDA